MGEVIADGAESSEYESFEDEMLEPDKVEALKSFSEKDLAVAPDKEMLAGPEEAKGIATAKVKNIEEEVKDVHMGDGQAIIRTFRTGQASQP